MIIKSATGTTMTEAVNWLIEKTMEAHDINRRNARKLLGEALVRTCILEEILATEDALIVKEGDGNGC